MKKFFLNLGHFFRIVDNDNLLSLTNLVIFVSIYKIITAPVFTITEVSSLLISMLAYGYKRHTTKQKQNMTDENKAALDELKEKVQVISDKASGLAVHVGMRNPIIK
jgi:hypothetical protein